MTLELPPSHKPDADTDFTTAVQTLWNLDANRLTPHRDYEIDVQSSKHPCNKDDAADNPLFTYVNGKVFQRPTFNTFRNLLDNYSAYTGDEEEVSSKELKENRDFLNAVMETHTMKYCHQYCIAKGVEYNGETISEDESEFKRVLNSIWFELYSRSGGGRRRKMDSSGFEHVFVGEVGLHQQQSYLLTYNMRNELEPHLYLGCLKMNTGEERAGIWLSQLDNVLARREEGQY